MIASINLQHSFIRKTIFMKFKFRYFANGKFAVSMIACTTKIQKSKCINVFNSTNRTILGLVAKINSVFIFTVHGIATWINELYKRNTYRCHCSRCRWNYRCCYRDRIHGNYHCLFHSLQKQPRDRIMWYYVYVTLDLDLLYFSHIVQDKLQWSRDCSVI